MLRASAAITNERSFVVIGSQAVLLKFPFPPEELLLSRELDLYPAMKPEQADLAAVAAREKDADVRALLRHRLTDGATLLQRADSLEPDRCDPARVRAWVQRRINEAITP